MNENIKAPFNFVPLNKKVFFPDWAELVNHDIPFSDHQSGVLNIKITTHSPIFISDGKKKDSNEIEEFFKVKDKYAIPASSIKGMVRSVLNIMSFGKIANINDNKYSVRDFSKSDNFYLPLMKPEKLYCGWLKKDGNKYVIEDCGKPARIKHDEIDRIFGTNFVSTFKKGTFKENDNENKTAEYKYKLVKNKNLTYNFAHKKASNGNEIYIEDKSSTKSGTIVFTGQSSGRIEAEKNSNGKIYEFIFFDKKQDLILYDKVVENFKFAYFDGRKTQPIESSDWKYWKTKLNNGEKVPVFFQKDSEKIIHFGLSYLYKLPYNHSIKDVIHNDHLDDNKPDLAETIFGYVNNKGSLKGRVHFSHLIAQNNPTPIKEVTKILGTPRASYYPIYIKQNIPYTTFMDENAEIAGKKRYPIHKIFKKPTNTKEPITNDNVTTTFKPLDEKVIFEGKMVYHNLKRVELGAILSALTFHHHTQNIYHSIGKAKAYGYGKISIEVTGINDNLMLELLKEYEYLMDKNIQNWHDTQELIQLLSMATEQNSTLDYMDLKTYADIKNTKEFLDRYTKLDNIKEIKLISLLSKEEKKKKEEYEQKQKEHQEWENVSTLNDINRINIFISKYPNSIHIYNANEIIKQIENDRKKKIENEKWDKLDKNNLKHLYSFKNTYPTFDKVKEIEELIKNLETKKEPTKKTIQDLEKTKDTKSFGNVLKQIDITSNNKSDIKLIAINIYQIQKGNKQKKFFSEAQIAKIDKELENEIKKELGIV